MADTIRLGDMVKMHIEYINACRYQLLHMNFDHLEVINMTKELWKDVDVWYDMLKGIPATHQYDYSHLKKFGEKCEELISKYKKTLQ